MQRLRDSKVIKDSKVEYRAGDPTGQMVLKPIKREQDQMRDPIDEIMRRGAKYILGYTGKVMRNIFTIYDKNTRIIKLPEFIKHCQNNVVC